MMVISANVDACRLHNVSSRRRNISGKLYGDDRRNDLWVVFDHSINSVGYRFYRMIRKSFLDDQHPFAWQMITSVMFLSCENNSLPDVPFDHRNESAFGYVVLLAKSLKFFNSLKPKTVEHKRGLHLNPL